jgi:hypothetical protein
MYSEGLLIRNFSSSIYVRINISEWSMIYQRAPFETSDEPADKGARR